MSWSVTYGIKSGHPWVSLEMHRKLFEFSWKSVSGEQTEVWMAMLTMSDPAIINKILKTAVKCHQMQLCVIPHYSIKPFCVKDQIQNLVCFWKYKRWVSVFMCEQKDSSLLNKISSHMRNWPCLHCGEGGSQGCRSILKGSWWKNYNKTGAEWQPKKRAEMIEM